MTLPEFTNFDDEAIATLRTAPREGIVLALANGFPALWVREVGPDRYEVSRRSIRQDYVNLGTVFSANGVRTIHDWAETNYRVGPGQRAFLPWDDAKRLVNLWARIV